MDNDEILVEDYKVVLNYVLEAENIVLRWERTFLLVNGIIFSLFIQILLSTYILKQFIIGFCAAAGIVISLIWFFIQARAYLYCRIREFRLNEIEKLMRELKPELHVFALQIDTEKYKKRKSKKENKEKKKEKIRWWEDLSTYRFRALFPLLIILLWMSLGITSLFFVF